LRLPKNTNSAPLRGFRPSAIRGALKHAPAADYARQCATYG